MKIVVSKQSVERGVAGQVDVDTQKLSSFVNMGKFLHRLLAAQIRPCDKYS